MNLKDITSWWLSAQDDGTWYLSVDTKSIDINFPKVRVHFSGDLTFPYPDRIEVLDEDDRVTDSVELEVKK